MTFPTVLPESTAIPLRGGAVQRWGVLAPGGIADDWVSTLHRNSDQRVHAVGSRSQDRADAFAARHGIPRAYGSYDQLVADPDIDVIYIASPHSEHRALALLAIAAGKHVLVEKPIALTAAEAREIADAARAAGVFAMEAMWSRFFPQTTIIKQLLDDGALGDVRMVTADLGFAMDYDPQGRMFNPDLGGGGLLDLGVYPIWFAHFALGAPDAVRSFGSLAPTGVDEQAALALEYGSGALALLGVSTRVETANRGVIAGTAARIELNPLFIGPTGFALIGEDDDRLDFAAHGGEESWRDGLVWQAAAVAQHIADGLTEAPEHPMATTIAQLETLDSARTQVGYPPR